MSGPDDAVTIRNVYDRQGFYVFRQVLSVETIYRLHGYLEHEIYTDQMPLLRHPSVTLEPHKVQITFDGKPFVSNALYNPHLEDRTATLGEILLNLICTDRTADALRILDGDLQHTLHQIIFFFAPAKTETHIDGWAIDTEISGDLCTLWIPLQRITLHNGPVCVFPWPRGKLLLPEMLGINNELNQVPPGEAYGIYHDALCRYIDKQDTSVVVPLLEPGDLVVFASTTPHATMPERYEGTIRRALQVMVRPSSRRWGGIMMSRMQGSYGEASDPTDVAFGDRWKLSMSQRRNPQ